MAGTILMMLRFFTAFILPSNQSRNSFPQSQENGYNEHWPPLWVLIFCSFFTTYLIVASLDGGYRPALLSLSLICRLCHPFEHPKTPWSVLGPLVTLFVQQNQLRPISERHFHSNDCKKPAAIRSVHWVVGYITTQLLADGKLGIAVEV